MRASLVLSVALCSFASSYLGAGCSSAATTPPPPPPCEEDCKDGVALKALRETMKLAFNLTLQGKPVGEHDLTTPCPLGGTARVFGTATSNAVQGATDVRLTYVLADCGYLFKDDDAEDNYSMRLDGTITQEGILAVQPSATSALVMKSEKMKLSGTVYDPPLDYAAECPIELGQNGNKLTGTICGREAKTDL
ncbi:MAG: hypothetical protein BGO98_21015 [Myxococcales bacterium 68-20]|nr:MAG: hypothetical protein BGO98_21015 [Myxococcales bacterium 68-20]